MRFASLGSGSRGNSTLVDSGSTALIIDCGFSKKEVTRRLSYLDFSAEQLDAILVTHEHSDHISGVTSLAEELDLPIYATYGTVIAGGLSSANKLFCFDADDQFEIGDITVQSVSVPHDAREPCQYRMSQGTETLGILTDLGMITTHVHESFACCDGLILEFNHDLTLLRRGPYPERLKERISGKLGHLSNVQAATFLNKIVRNGFFLVVAHVSLKNNTKELIFESLSPIRDQSNFEILFAEQDAVSEWVEVSNIL